ncbi:multisubunit Na+/H+ antiporter, MnhF subunit [Coriobacteriaceae bacterium EMTCatB1]|nr:multisubunit Na+/H+ antiporter, MnhF subunit [Coriobacteriaceae bacterium EMTCatB1]
MFLWGVAVFLLAVASICLYRAYMGPTALDRVLAVNVIGTKTMVLLVMLAFVFGRPLYIDVALVYALLNFVTTVVATRCFETGVLEGDWQ